MIKRKYFLIPFLITVAIVVFELQSFVSSKNIVKTEETVVVKKPAEPLHSAEIAGVIAKFDSILTQKIDESHTVGAAVAIVYKNEIAYKKCFGVRKKGEKAKVDEHTVFRLASVSKTVTGVLAGIMAEEGVIKLDDKVVDYLPDFKLKTEESTEQLTVGNLLSHTSGIIPHAFDGMVEDHVPLFKIIKKLVEVDITAAPGKIYGYQNVVFSLYDTIAQVKTSEDYCTLVKEKVFEPFGMTDASASFGGFKNSGDFAYPHYGSGKYYRPLRLNDRYYSTAPAAGVNASINDMSHFLLTLLDNNSPVINDRVRELIFTPQVKSPLKRTYFRRWNKVSSKEYAIGWRIVGYKNHTVAYHGGYVQGYRAEIALCEDEQVGIVFLSNSPNSIDSEVVPVFLNMFFKLKETEKDKKPNV